MARNGRSSLDDTDWSILGVLLNDGRTANREIARAIGLPESTVRNRLRALLEEEFIQIRALLNADRFGPIIEIMALVVVEAGEIESVARALAALVETQKVRRIMGNADLAVEAGLANEEKLTAYLDAVSAIPGIKSVQFNQFLGMYKGQYVIPHGWTSRQVGGAPPSG